MINQKIILKLVYNKGIELLIFISFTNLNIQRYLLGTMQIKVTLLIIIIGIFTELITSYSINGIKQYQGCYKVYISITIA